MSAPERSAAAIEAAARAINAEEVRAEDAGQGFATEGDLARAALTAAAPLLLDPYELRERGLRVLGDEQCCELACDGGGCESCPCCCAGWCVKGHIEIPARDLSPGSDYRIWLDVAADHNPTAKLLAQIEGTTGLDFDDPVADAEARIRAQIADELDRIATIGATPSRDVTNADIEYAKPWFRLAAKHVPLSPWSEPAGLAAAYLRSTPPRGPSPSPQPEGQQP